MLFFGAKVAEDWAAFLGAWLALTAIEGFLGRAHLGWGHIRGKVTFVACHSRSDAQVVAQKRRRPPSVSDRS